MITIKPSDVSDPAAPPEGEEHKKTIPLVWIPATLIVGLLIAGIYLGARIVAAHRHPKADVAHVPTPPPNSTPIPASPTVTAVKSQTQSPPPDTQASAKAEPPLAPQKPAGSEPLTLVSPGDGIPMIAPNPGQVYIQVGALDQEATRRFVQHLRDEHLDPHVAPGPTPQLMRVLIGPFDNRPALNERKAQLTSEGVDTFIREY
jgi:cell division septation protein DedD